MRQLMYVVYNEYATDYVEFGGLYYSADLAQAECDELNEEAEGSPWDYTSLSVQDNKEPPLEEYQTL